MKFISPLLTCLICSLLVLSCNDEDKPFAEFSFDSNLSGEVSGASVYFTNSSKNGTRYKWNFGDGEFSEEKNTRHTYKANGTYTVTLTVDGVGGSAKIEKTLIVKNVFYSSSWKSSCDLDCSYFLFFGVNTLTLSYYRERFGSCNETSYYTTQDDMLTIGDHINAWGCIPFYNSGGSYTFEIVNEANNGHLYHKLFIFGRTWYKEV